MKKNLNVLLILFIIFQTVYSQNVIFKAKDILVTNQTKGNGILWYYSNKILIKTNNPPAFDKDSPEAKFYDFFTIKSNEQLQSFFNGNIPKSYSKSNYLELMRVYFNKPDKNYYELDSKIQFDNGNSKVIFLKYINHNNVFPKPIASVVYLELTNGTWQLKDIGDNFELGIFFCCVKTGSLNMLFRNSLSDNDKSIMAAYINQDGINFRKLMDTFFELKKNNPNHPLIKFLYDAEYSIF